MAMKIYRTHYYPSTYPIYRPQPNKAAFIRRGYYGGHTDVYKPYGKGLFYYDVNSLYPYAMTNPMPGGKPVWHGKLKGCDLEQLFGFVEAKVTCPDSPSVDEPCGGTLRFSGHWISTKPMFALFKLTFSLSLCLHHTRSHWCFYLGRNAPLPMCLDISQLRQTA